MVSTDISRVVERYDEAMYQDEVRAIWAGSDFCNFGYWRLDTADHKQAGENLVNELLAFIPEKKGKVLDVACGLGATTRHLANYFAPADIVGVNFSEKQLGTARQKLPEGGFARMDAVKLAFQDESFDNVVCVEAAFHFDTRAHFLREAHRVLKPGGRLVLSDILVPRWISRLRSSVTVRNMTLRPEEYRQSFADAGFRNLEMVNAKTECVTRMARHHRRWAGSRLAKSWNVRPFLRLMLFDLALLAGTEQYLLVSAQKP
jgi:MPBQ/MSBQ methyltransferase